MRGKRRQRLQNVVNIPDKQGKQSIKKPAKNTKETREIQEEVDCDSASSDSEEDLARVTSRNKRSSILNSSGSEDETTEPKKSIKPQDDDSTSDEPATPSGRKRRIRCVDSDSDTNTENTAPLTPAEKRRKRLQEMSQRKKAKKRLPESDSSESGPESDANSDDLPMFENEEELPPGAIEREAKDSDENSNDSFVCDDDEVELESDASESPEEEEEEEEASKDEKKSKRKFNNPYLDMNNDLEKDDIMDVLSKNTARDKRNAENYKKELGKYQFSVNSEANKAATVSKKLRYKRNMAAIKFDQGFKEDRNLDVKDEEYFDSVETALFGERVQVYPHTKRVNKLQKSDCSLKGCGARFTFDETKIIGVKKFDPFNLMFMKKKTKFEKESYYWICYKHVYKIVPGFDNSSSDEYNSD